MAATPEQMIDALSNAIVLDISNDTNDIDLIKSVTGTEELNVKNLQRVLDSIYINGKNLTDKLGENNEYNIADYARAVREALSPENDSFITIMKRNSVLSKPRAVIVDMNSSDTEHDDIQERKANASLSYVASYKEDIQKAVRDASNELSDREHEDAHLFFSHLFGEDENTQALPYKEFTEEASKRFDCILPGFVKSRYPEHKVYAYMLTKDFPEGSGKRLTLDEILTNNTPEMKEFKKKIGREFCEIFQKPAGNDVEHFNKKTYPALLQMTDAILHIKSNYNDISEKDSIKNAVLNTKKLNLVFGMVQDFQISDIAAIARAEALALLNELNMKQMNYLASDIYTNEDPATDDREFQSYGIAVGNEAFFDSVDMNDIKKISSTAAGIMDMRRCTILSEILNMVEFYNGEIQYNKEAISNYLNGQGGILRENYENGEARRIVREAAISVERDRENENGDLLLNSIATGVGRIDPSVLPSDDMRSYLFGKYSNNINKYMSDQPYDGIKKSILNDLTGCPTILSREPNEDDKKRLMAAVNTIYINDKSMAEYFNLNMDNIASEIKGAEKRLTALILSSMENNGPEFVFVKNGRDNFQEINVRFVNEPSPIPGNKPEGMSDEEYQALSERATADRKYTDAMRSQREAVFKKSAKTAKAYADMLSGKADKKTVEEYKDIFSQNKMKMPAANISVNSLIGVLSRDETGDVLSGFVGGGRKLNHQELEEAAKNIYIGNKSLAQLCPKRENMNDEEVTRQREQLLKDNFNNLLVNNDKEPQLMSIRDKNGVLKPLRITNLGKPPEEPKPVKLYSKFETHFHFDSTVAANIKAYEEYINKNEDYKRDKALYDKLTKYNGSAEDTRLNIINEERLGPTQRPVSVNQLQMTNGTARQNTPALTQPAAQRGAAQNERAME